MRLNGKKIYLDAIQESMIPLQQGWIGNEEVVRYGGIIKTKAQTIEEIINYNKKLQADNNVRLFGIYTKQNEYIGNIRLDIEWVWRVATISLLIGKKEMWGQGMGGEAINLITDFGFNTLGMDKIEAGVLDGNIASLKAFGKAGFIKEGRKRSNRFLDGKRVDVILLGKVNVG